MYYYYYYYYYYYHHHLPLLCFHQSQIGEYFGAEIVTMAVNPSQMFTKVVLIAAPLHMEADWEGRVYVCPLTASVSNTLPPVQSDYHQPVITINKVELPWGGGV